MFRGPGALSQASDKPSVLQRRYHIHQYPDEHERRSQPQRNAWRLGHAISLRAMKLLQKQAEAGKDESEAHKREPGSDPRQQRPLGRKICARILLYIVWHVDSRIQGILKTTEHGTGVPAPCIGTIYGVLGFSSGPK